MIGLVAGLAVLLVIGLALRLYTKDIPPWSGPL